MSTQRSFHPARQEVMEAFSQPLPTPTVTMSWGSPHHQNTKPGTSLDPGVLGMQSSTFITDGELRSFANLMGQADGKPQPFGFTENFDSLSGYDCNEHETLSTDNKTSEDHTKPAHSTVKRPGVPNLDCISPLTLELNPHSAPSANNKQLRDQPQPTHSTRVESSTDKEPERLQPEPPRRRGRPRKSKRNNPSRASEPNIKTTAPRLSTSSIESATSQDPTSGEQHLEKHEDSKRRLRARNRESAKKFRIRKRDGIEKLHEKENQARKTNESLVQEASKLCDEILELKTMVLRHAGCGFPFIEEYIQSMARQLAQKNSLKYSEPRSGTLPSVPISNDASMADVGR